MQFIRKLFFVGLCMVFLTGTLNASGFSIFEQGARSMGFAGAFTARVNDLSAIFHNPAGLANLYGTNVQFGTTLIKVNSDFIAAPSIGGSSTSLEKQWFYPSTFYLSSRINDKVTAGFGFNTQYGLGIRWPENWIGNQIVTEVNLKTFFLTPSIACKVNDQLNIGAGFSYVIAKVDLANFIPLAALNPLLTGVTSNNIEADGSGMGFNVGAQYKVDEMITLGVSYRHSIKLKADDGTATLSANPVPGLTSGGVSAELSLPSTLSFGIGYMPNEKMAVELDINRTGWSSYDKLTIEYENILGLRESVKDWKDVMSFRLGLEYFLNENVTLRCGGYLDKSPVSDEYLDPMLPDADRTGINLGIGYNAEKFVVDAAFLYLKNKDRETTTSVLRFNGEYKSNTILFGLSFSYKIN